MAQSKSLNSPGTTGAAPISKALSTWDDEPCHERCRSKQHGQKIWEIAQGGNEDSEVVCLWAKTCSNYSQVKDEFGRTALHAAATTGNLKAVEWLLKTQQCNINAKDMISGYTPLHRSIYFGHLHVARSLIKLGADVNLRDHEGLTPFELCQMDRPITFKQNAGDMTELTIWGSNANYNLGIGHQEPRLHPDVAPEFRRPEMSLTKVQMNTYHTLFLTKSGEVYACGYGMGGRLGIGEGTVLSPSVVHLRNNGKCRDIAVGQDHSIFLTDSKVWTVGSNEFGQLGQNNQTSKLCNPRTVDALQKYGITGILAGPCHSVFYNSQTVLVCGQNQGQFGRGFEDVLNVYGPTKLKLSFDNVTNNKLEAGVPEVTTVGGNEFCTAICIEKQSVFLLRRHQYTKIESRNTKTQEILKVQVSGEKNSITLFMLTVSGRVLVWRENFNRSTNESKGAFTRLVFSNSRLLDVKDFSISLSSLVVVTNTGEAYKAGWNCNNPPSIVGKINERFGHTADTDFQVAVRQRRGKRDDDSPSVALELIKIKRVPNVHTGLYVSCDPKGNNFAILQRHQMMDVTDLLDETATTTSSVIKDITELYDDMTEDDSIHDVTFDLDSFHKFPAHRFIVATASPVIGKILQNNIDCRVIKVTNKLFGIDPVKCTSLENARVFHAILDLIYKQQCSFTSSENMQEILQCCKTEGKRNISLYSQKWKELSRFRSLCRHLGLETAELVMQRFMSELDTQWEMPIHTTDVCLVSRSSSKNWNEIPDIQFTFDDNNPYWDVTLECNDKVVFHVHKCILVARLHYFKSMFSTNWSLHQFGQSSSKGNQAQKMVLPFTSKAIAILLECVYTNSAKSLKEVECELICETIACSDYMMNDRLLLSAESSMIRNITLKNAADILAFTWKHNGSQLKNTCFDFISLNLTAMLENRLLDSLPVEILQELSTYYRTAQRNNLMICRELGRCGGVPDSKDYLEAMKYTSEEILEQLELIVETDGAMMLKKSQAKTPRSRVRLRSRTLSESETILETPEESPTGAYTGVTPRRNDNLRLSCNLDDTIMSPSSPPYFKDTTSPVTPSTSEKERKLIVPLPKNTIGVATPQKLQNSPIKFDEFPTLGACAVVASSPIQNIMFKPIATAAAVDKAMSLTKAVNSPRPTLVSPPSQKPQIQTPTSSSSSKKKTKWRPIRSAAEVVLPTKPGPNSAEPCRPTEQLTADGRDRNNPWKINNKNNQVVFKAIVEDEVEKKKNFEKATSKPLPMMQAEDEAINYLTKHYTSEDTADYIEILTVERVVTSNFSTPMWVQHAGAVALPTNSL